MTYFVLPGYSVSEVICHLEEMEILPWIAGFAGELIYLENAHTSRERESWRQR